MAVNSKVPNKTNSGARSKSIKPTYQTVTEELAIESNVIKGSISEDEQLYEKSKEAVEIAYTRDHEINRAPVEPGILSIDKQPELITDNMKALTPIKSMVAAGKTVIKPFKGSRFSITVFYSKDLFQAA